MSSLSPLAPDEDYARMIPRGSGPRVWAGAVLLLAGLGLIVLAGCFLLGALSLIKPQLIDPKLPADAMSAEAHMLLISLYVVAVGCLLGAVIFFVLGVRSLLRVFREAPTL